MNSDHQNGLDANTALRRLAEVGPNEIEKPRNRTLWAIVRGTLREPMFLLLLAASAIYLAIGDLGEGLFLVCGAALTIGLVVVQEARSEGALRALRQLAQPSARVVRDGADKRILARELVPGDLVLIGEGERAPADGDLIGGDVLSIDESLLTGESAPVTRRPKLLGADGGESRIYAGTMIVRGSGRMIVTETGPRTKFGQIGASLAHISEELTPLQKTARRLVGYLAIAALGFCIVVFVAYGLIRNDWLGGGLTALTVAISLLPEEFPMVLAVFLAVGSWRLARHNVLVRRSAVIEALGGATILCVDKTGTLTRNQMQLTKVWTQDRVSDVAPDAANDPAVAQLLEEAALASAVRAVDPMDRAILKVVSPDRFKDKEPVRTWPLRPERLAVVQAWADDGGGQAVAAKGAPETIFRMCQLPEDRVQALHAVIDQMAAEGLRVLGVASTRLDAELPAEPDAIQFDFRGLIGFIDPLRDDVRTALGEAMGARIAVAMITGDHPSTALALASQAGIDTKGGVLTGTDVQEMDAETLRRRLKDVRVLARIAPDQKVRIVKALKADGEVVVMTGDGVNDGPALQTAHIGIAMGKRGSDVAREAADIVLLDDSFASIVGGVRLGRRIFANLRKALTFITAVHVPLAGLALLPILFGWPPLFLPMHVVLLELVIDPACSLVFEAEPSDAKSMKRPPRSPDEPLFGPTQIAFALLQGAIVLAAMIIYFGWALSVASEDEARGAAFASLIIANLTLALADSAGGRAGLLDRSHTAFWVIAGLTGVVLVAVLYVPPLAALLQVAPPDASLFLPGLALAVSAGGWWGLFRRARNMLAPQRAV
jgi:P-type Ca2+ transporter type 2C